MITKKQLKEEKASLESLRGLVGVYEEIAATKMQKVRGAVIQTRYFLEGLLHVYHKAKAAYESSNLAGVTLRRKNGLMVAVFVSANSGLYGDIVERTFEEFKKFVTQNNCQVVILGKLGVKMMDELMPGYFYNYYDISDDEVDLDSFPMVMGYLLQYEKIMVFYGQFKSILNQDPVMTSVTGDVKSLGEKNNNTGTHGATKFLFEPTPADIAKLFEGEIVASVFEQTLHEASLAKFASRMLSLDKAADNVEQRIHKVGIIGKRWEHQVRSRKQLNMFSGVRLWRR